MGKRSADVDEGVRHVIEGSKARPRSAQLGSRSAYPAEQPSMLSITERGGR